MKSTFNREFQIFKECGSLKQKSNTENNYKIQKTKKIIQKN